MASLSVCGLTHYYKKNRALYDVTAEIGSGVTALIGPNGAGKTTFINAVVGLLQPTRGAVLFNGENIASLGKRYFEHIGYCPQSPRFYPNFTAEEFLYYIGAMKGLNKNRLGGTVDRLFELVNLAPQRRAKISTFSGGMKQRLGIAQALLNDPSLLILDEPTAGLDPIERIRFRNLLSEISADRTVILATHIISDVESIAGRFLLLCRGELIVNGTPEDVLAELSGSVWSINGVDGGEVKAISQSLPVSNVRKLPDGGFEVKVVSEKKPAESALPAQPTLEDAFLRYFGEGGILP